MSASPAASRLLARAFPDAPELDANQRLARFLDEFWQQRALHLPAALGDFELPLDADELAGLACEPDADARIVRGSGADLELLQGPFEPEIFATLGETDWTLLVNGVDLAIPGFEPLLEAARFVPDWRLDDLMISFAAPGGSVGPHFDRYDVFLLQAEGVRRWELSEAADGADRPRAERGGLLLVDGFEPDRVLRCAAGDGLYVPPGVVHHGVAETPCMTLSLGLRAPSVADLVTDWALFAGDALRDDPAGSAPAALDPPLPATAGVLADATVARARALLRERLLATLDGQDDATLAAWLGELLSRPGRNARFDATDPIGPEALGRELRAGAVLERAPGLRLLVRPDGSGSRVFAGGEAFTTALEPAALGAFTGLAPLTAPDLESPAALRLAAELCSAGRLQLMDGNS